MKAGFRVTGVDNVDHSKRYPGHAFIQGDAIQYLIDHGHEYDVIHASPPCQAYSISTAGNPKARAKHERLIPAVRDAMPSDVLWVIENVPLAASELVDPYVLCGRMFGLGANDADGYPLVMDRHRLFETNFTMEVPEHPKHGDEQVAGVYDGARRSQKPNATPADDRYSARYERKGGYVPRSLAVRRELLGIDWMTVKQMYESIPPAYSEYIGKQMIERLDTAPVVM